MIDNNNDTAKGVSLSKIARLDTCVTVVDAFNFFKNWKVRNMAHQNSCVARNEYQP